MKFHWWYIERSLIKCCIHSRWIFSCSSIYTFNFKPRSDYLGCLNSSDLTSCEYSMETQSGVKKLRIFCSLKFEVFLHLKRTWLWFKVRSIHIVVQRLNLQPSSISSTNSTGSVFAQLPGIRRWCFSSISISCFIINIRDTCQSAKRFAYYGRNFPDRSWISLPPRPLGCFIDPPFHSNDPRNFVLTKSHGV